MKKKEATTAKTKTATNKSFFNMGDHFNTKLSLVAKIMAVLVLGFILGFFVSKLIPTNRATLGERTENKFWFVLFRESNLEQLMEGVPGDTAKSKVIKTFKVKAGVPGRKPTPLPELLGKKYWVITKKFDSSVNPETAPYFLELNVPAPDTPPYGPSPYLECFNNIQCDWEIPGPFGLHGVNGDLSRLSEDNEGSSGCIRHNDEDITYLYNILDPQNEEIRYYIKDI